MPLLRNIAGIGTIDPVPGQQYDGQVLDKGNRPIAAGFVFLDADGNEISQVFATDSNGIFHFTVPDHNYQNIFVYFFSTDEYGDTVKSFDELVNDGPVILPGKTKGSTLLLAGAGVAAFALLIGNSKRIGTTSKPTNKTLLMYGVGAAGIIYLLSYKPTPQQKEYLKQAKNMLDYLSAEKGIVPSLTSGQFSSLAVAIRRAVDKCGSDEDAIFNSFRALNNEADLYKLIIDYGIAKYDGCFEGKFPSWNVHYTLTESLYSDLDIDDIDYINGILSGKGINFQF
jgi:hypothetical protein